MDSLKNGVFVTTSKNTKALFGVFALVFVFFVILASFAFMTMKSFDETSDSLKSENAKIGVITIEGVIMASKDVVELLQKAEEDKNLEAIILRIDSPGGAVGPTQEIYDEIIRIDATKPIYASFGSMAASGGYYLGAATRKIWSNRGTLTGSIGVIMQFMDLSKLYEFAKVSPNVIKAGKYKDIGSMARPMTEEESGLMNTMIANVHDQFIRDIMKRREKKIVGDIKAYAQGQIFSGEEALERGLVDELGSLWQAGRTIHKDLKIKGDFALKYIEKKKKTNLLDLMGSLESAVNKLNIDTLTQSASAPRLMFR